MDVRQPMSRLFADLSMEDLRHTSCVLLGSLLWISVFNGGEGLSYRTRSFLCKSWKPERDYSYALDYKDDVVWKMFRRFGEVNSVDREKSKFDIFEAELSVRLVKMVLSADDIKCLPHILYFRCGTRALASVQGRPLLCLKCMPVGHVRRDSGAHTGARRLVSAPAPPTRDEGNAWQRQKGRTPAQEAAPVAAVAAPAEEAAPPEQRTYDGPTLRFLSQRHPSPLPVSIGERSGRQLTTR